jgi:hypothetical protein
MAAFNIDRRQLMAELNVAEPILKKEAERVMREEFFEPAVEGLKDDFAAHPVTREIAAGVDAPNISNTLDAPFRNKDEMDSPANLTSFIGFDEAPEQVLAPILQRLDPRHRDGPKLVYKGKSKDKTVFTFEVRAPDEEKIENATGLPWAEGISWVKRIEQGIPGIGHFLNVKGRPSSRSGGGIQIDGQLRQGRFKPTSYLSKLFNNFLRRVVGRAENGRGV